MERVSVSFTVSRKLLQELDKLVASDTDYNNRSHAIALGIELLLAQKNTEEAPAS